MGEGNGSESARSGVFRRDRGWGLVLFDGSASLRTVALRDAVVVGSASRDALVTGPGVAPEHVKIAVRADGCYIEDLGTPGGTFVAGVQARRIGVGHGDVVRMGDTVALFVENDLVSYAGTFDHVAGLLVGPRQREAWVQELQSVAAGAGRVLYLEGPSGVGKATLARQVAAQHGGPIVTATETFEAASASEGAVVLALDVDTLPRRTQLELLRAVHAGASLVATGGAVAAASADGRLAAGLAGLLEGQRRPANDDAPAPSRRRSSTPPPPLTHIRIPTLDERREDLVAIACAHAERRGIDRARLGAPFLEGLLRAGWPGGVGELTEVVDEAAAATPDGPIDLDAVAHRLHRAPPRAPMGVRFVASDLARARVVDALAAAEGSVAAAARRLNLSRQAFYREAQSLGVDLAQRALLR